MKSYATLEYADDYHQQRQTNSQWADYSDTQKQQRLFSASDCIDRLFHYIGQPQTPEQIRAFPRFLPIKHHQFRQGLFERQQKLSDAADTPEAVKQACCELALLDDISGSLKNAQTVKNIGGITLATGQCPSENKDWHIAVFSAMRLLKPYAIDERNGRLTR